MTLKGKNWNVTAIIQVRDDGLLKHGVKFKMQYEREPGENRRERSKHNSQESFAQIWKKEVLQILKTESGVEVGSRASKRGQ